MLFKEITFNSNNYRKTLELRTKILREPLGKKLSESDLEGEEHQLHFAVFNADALISCVVIKPVENGTGKLRQMAVDESVQGKGIGKFIIAETEASLLEKGFLNIEMSARETAVGFYQTLGYEVVDEPFLEQGIEHLKMVKHL